MKKFFLSMLALASMAGVATAQEVVATVDFTKMSEYPWGEPDGFTAEMKNGAMEVTGNGWYQFPIAQSVELSAETTYTLTVGMKGSTAGSGNIAVGNWGGDGWIDSGITINFGEEWAKCSATFTTNTADAAFNIMFQPGQFAEVMDFAWVVVSKGDAEPESTPDFPKEGPVDPTPGGDVKVVSEVKYSDFDKYPYYVMGYEPTIENGILTAEFTEDWYQFFVMTDLKFEPEVEYGVRTKIKGSEAASLNVQLGNWGALIEAPLAFTTEWSEVTVKIGAPVDEEGNPVPDGFIVFQPGVYGGVLEIEWVQLVTFEGGDDPNPPVETVWTSIITNGDANNGVSPNCLSRIDGEDVESPLADNPTGSGKVFEAPIVAHPEDSDEITDWSSQFFIQFNEAVPEGTKLKVSFDYYCTTTRTIQTQAHGTAGNYHHYQFLGDLNAKAEWQSFSKEVTVSAEQAGSEGCQAIAFNLSTTPDEGIFYINNIVVEKEGEAGIEAIAPVYINRTGVYNLMGVKVLDSANADDLNALPRGIYIVNGKKMIIGK